MSQLEQLKASFAATTKGEWDFHIGTNADQIDFASLEVHPENAPQDTLIMLQGATDFGADVEFIALAHNLMPVLLDAVDVVRTDYIGNPRATAILDALEVTPVINDAVTKQTPFVFTEESIHDLTELALNEACYAIQKAIGQTDGGIAGVFFSGTNKSVFKEMMADYVLTESYYAESK